MSASENLAIVAANLEGFNKRDRKACDLSSPSMRLQDVPTGRVVVGPDGEWEFWQFWTTAFPDGKVDVRSNAGAEDGTVVTEFHGIGTHNGPLVSPDGQQIPASGRPIDIPFCQVARVEGGKIVEAKLYYDLMTILAQVGAIPQGATA